jgi:glycosyltransferase involved in cell wall biosynthesis
MKGDPAGAPLVSVIVPTYQRDHWLPGVLDSVFAQDFEDFELIVSDSAGSDDTRALVEAQGDARLRYRRNPSPLDTLGNHAAAFAEARGRYVAVIHDDDLWEPGFLMRSVEALELNGDCVLAFCDQSIMSATGTISPRDSDAVSRLWGRDGLEPGTHKPFWHLLLQQSIPTVAGCMFRRAALQCEDFTAEAGLAIDFWLGYVLCRSGDGAYYIPERLVRYRVHDGSETWFCRDAGESTLWVWEQIIRDPGVAWARDDATRRLARARQRSAFMLLRLGRRRAAFRQALRAFRDRPSPRSLAVLALTGLPRPALASLGPSLRQAAHRIPRVALWS